MQSKLHITLGSILAALAIVTTSISYAGNTGAVSERLYYSDATYTTVVGERSTNTCTGWVYTTGQVTQYSKILGTETISCDYIAN